MQRVGRKIREFEAAQFNASHDLSKKCGDSLWSIRVRSTSDILLMAVIAQGFCRDLIRELEV